jgi:hypothetical protein
MPIGICGGGSHIKKYKVSVSGECIVHIPAIGFKCELGCKVLFGNL